MSQVHTQQDSGGPAPAATPSDAPAGGAGSTGSPSSKGWRAWSALLPEAVTLALCAVLWDATSEWKSSVGGPGPAFYPRMLILLLALAMVVRLVHDLRAIRRGTPVTAEEDVVIEEGAELDASLIEDRRVLVAVALSAGYVLATLFLGWVIATFCMVVVFLALTGRRNPLIVVPVALLLSVGFAYVFVKVVYISLPTGVGPFDYATVLLFELLGAY